MVKATNENERLYLKFFETLSSGDLEKIRADLSRRRRLAGAGEGNPRRGLASRQEGDRR